ncbi:hypothetical protein DVS28_a0386 [Euzebya pacifica]|uniref:Oxidoreductase n=1 Tax=Euzebya pacifica TaxID=1608957 RepID=A0A346XS96_9ACTN|nr:DoxX family protein [Euzebya pacifica]AXV05093.1 hypothetical protein DVS28_a0386 [Euzebya pacifica]
MSTIHAIHRSFGRASAAVPVVVRVVIGIIMATHGWQKLTQMGAANFGNGMLADLGVPLPGVMGHVVTWLELVGGIALVVGFLTRASAAVLAVVLAGATVLVKVDLGLIAGMGAPLPGAELDLALLVGLFVSVVMGPGRPSLDHLLGLEDTTTVVVDVSDRAATPVG